MRGRAGWVGVAGGVAGLVLSALGVVPAGADDPPALEPLSMAGMAVPLSLSGELVTWGTTDEQSGSLSLEVPAEYEDVAFSQVLPTSNAMIALTAEGRVVGWGQNQYRSQQIPAAVQAEKVVQIASTGDAYVGAVTVDGRVLVWGPKRTRQTPLNVPEGLTGVKKLEMADDQALALKHDGTVVAWGSGPTPNAVSELPEGLLASDIALSTYTATALTPGGSVVQWGSPDGMTGRPASVGQPGSVKAIARRNSGVLAWLADDSLVVFGSGHQRAVPVTVAAAQPLLLANSWGYGLAMVDQDRVIRQWVNKHVAEPDEESPAYLPAGLSGRAISHLTLGELTIYSDGQGGVSSGGAIVTRVLRAALPRVVGSAVVGSVLTGVAGTFSGAPDGVVSVWVVGGVVVPGAQLTVTAAMVGKTIVYRSTASKSGEGAVAASSVGVVVAPVVSVPVSSSSKVVKVAVAKKAASVTVSGKVSASKSPVGKAVVTIKKGKKTIVVSSVGVSAAGAVKLVVKKFAQLVAKKLKVKGKKAKSAYRGAYTVSIAYGGNAQVKASAGAGKFTIKK